MTLRLVSDENFDRDIIRRLLYRNPALDLVRVQDAGLRGAADPAILAWAANEDRVLLTHDVKTMTHFAYKRVRRGEPMPGILEVSDRLPLGRAIEAILIVAECSVEGEWEGQVGYLPL